MRDDLTSAHRAVSERRTGDPPTDRPADPSQTAPGVCEQAPPTDPADLPSVIEAVHRMKQTNTVGTPLKIDIYRNCTLDALVPFLEWQALRANALPTVHQSEYDTVIQDLLTEPGLNGVVADLSIMLLYPEDLLVRGPTGFDPAQSLERLEAILTLLARRTETVAIATLAAPAGLTAGLPAATGQSVLTRLNLRITDFADAHDQCRLIDVAGLAGYFGDAAAFDQRSWYRFRAPYHRKFLQTIAATISPIIRDKTGCAKKCLVLDCDDTLWGGIVGEVGLDGIALDQQDGPGRIYFDFQRQVMALQQSGIMIALLSKNNEEDVLAVLDNHPDCLLRREHLVGWKIDWNDKPGNLRRLSEALNIGLDSFVFIDDSDLEVSLMRDRLPAVTTLQVPRDRSRLPGLLAGRDLFAPRAGTREDKNRTRMYREATQRDSNRGRFDSLCDFLTSLNITAKIHPIRNDEIKRVAQLLGRTNQFRLTGWRPGEAEIRASAGDPTRYCYTLSAQDRFGDLGLVGVMMISADAGTLSIDNLAFSCRALGRKLEDCLIITGLRRSSADVGCDRLAARYEPTPKNRQVNRLLDRFGLTRAPALANGTVPYTGAVSAMTVDLPDFIRIDHD